VSTPEPPVSGVAVLASAAALRRRFDESFARPAGSTAERREEMLAIRVAGEPYALRLSEVAGLRADLKIVPVPSPAGPLLGIVGVRGSMAPIYDLAALLGHPPVAAPRWVAFARAQQFVGLAFETFESYLCVAEDSLAADGAEEPGTVRTRPQVRGTARAAGLLRPIIHMPSVVDMLKG
jgi:purine-binding chemotaxis protein CheW